MTKMHFKKFILVLLAAVIAIAVVFGCRSVSEEEIWPPRPWREPDGHAAGWDMTVNPDNLNFVITSPDGESEWHSGRRQNRQYTQDGQPAYTPGGDPIYDDGFNTAMWQRRVTSGITVGFRARGSIVPPTVQGIENIANNRITLTQITGGYRAMVNLPIQGIRFDVILELYDGFVQVTIPFDSIAETGNAQLMFISIAPFFGASFGLADGFILIPDGSGAIIDTSLPTATNARYVQRVYGQDHGMTGFVWRDSRSPRIVGMPVFGISREGAPSSFKVISSGAEFAEINALVNGQMNQRYNHTYVRFMYRDEYVRQHGGQTHGVTTQETQENKNIFDAQMRFYLLKPDNADLSSMANIYRDYLEEMKMLPDNNLSGDTPLRVQFLMAENRDGMFGDTTVTMTTTSFVKDAAIRLNELSDNLNISLLGFRSGGRSGTAPRHFGVESSTGSSRSYRNMAAELESRGIRVSYALDYMRGSHRASVRARDIAMNPSNQFVDAHSGTGHYESFHMLTIDGMNRAIDRERSSRRDMRVNEVDFIAKGHMLYSSWYHQVFSRTDMKRAVQVAARNIGHTINMEMPNDYMWRYTSSYLSAPVGSSGFLIAHSCVPFMSMVLSGSMNLFSEPQNIVWRGDNALRLIDFNIYPSFTLTERDSIELALTRSAYIFSSRYNAWIDRITELYTKVDSVLGNVRGQRIVSRERLSPGVYQNTFCGGGSTIVDFNTGEARFVASA